MEITPTVTENGALALSSTGSLMADQFSKAGSHRDRDIQTVFSEQSSLHKTYGAWALRFVFYLRMITRTIKSSTFNSETVQKGQGNRDESFKRLLWYLVYEPETFYNNLFMLPLVGSSKDIIDIIGMADKHGLSIDYERALSSGMAMSDAQLIDLTLKYVPLQKASSKCKTPRSKSRNFIAKKISQLFGVNAKEMRKIKAGGGAHQWQQAISQRLFEKINFSHIPGKALFNLVNSKFLANQGLETAYEKWIEAQPIAKFTGYVYELYNKVKEGFIGIKPMKKYQLDTINKQFDGLVALASKDGNILGNVWCALDTSGSMGSAVANATSENPIRAVDVCISLGIYFSSLNKGAFHKNVIMFNSTSKILQLSGSFTDMIKQVPHNAMGGTNFQSVIEEIVRVRVARPDIPVSDYPQTLIVVSDMQFNPASTGEYNFGGWMGASHGTGMDTRTNHQAQMAKLTPHFPEEWIKQFRVIWWDCTGRVISNQPSSINEGGTFVFSGFDGAVITLLLGGEQKEQKEMPTMEEAIRDALDQEVLKFIPLG